MATTFLETAWVSKAVKAAISKGVSPAQSAVFVINATEMAQQVTELKNAFPSTAIHAFACKANPLSAVLKRLKSLGMACETASIGEFTTAHRIFGDRSVVFDSPVKTDEELRHCVQHQCFINLDNFQEVERVAALYSELHPAGRFRAEIGLRINPQAATGSIGALVTGRATSKFGIGLIDARPQLLEAYQKFPFLTMVHVHTGSQGLPVEIQTEAIRVIHEFANELPPRVTWLDIGGGLSVNFGSDEYLPGFSHYASELRKVVPSLFEPTSRFRMITEMGRTIVAKAGIYLSRVEYTKTNGGRYIVQQHCGHDLLLRTVWCPNDWPLRVHFYDSATGAMRTADPRVTDVAGPCCLGGDLACRERLLPKAEVNDVCVIRDVGGYYHVSYNYYNLRPAPPVYFYEEEGEISSLTMIHRGRTVEETIAFFECIE